jgi:hypothetical protein
MTPHDLEHDPYAEALAAAPRPMTAAFLRSPAYALLMNRHVPDEGPGPHEANAPTRSYIFRHATAGAALGAWRWRGMQRMVNTLAPFEGRIIDFGGAASPLGLGSLVVDRAPRDAYGRAVHAMTLRGLRAPCVFTSHTLEHCEDLMGTLAEIREALDPGGLLVAHVPSWTCERWRAGVHKSSDHGDHRWTFGLRGDLVPLEPPVEYMRSFRRFDTVVERAGFDVEDAAYCGDDSIMVVARR